MHAVRGIDLQAKLSAFTRHHLVHLRRTKARARMPVLLPADGMTYLRVHEQVRRLIFSVPCPREMHVRQFVERQHTIGLHLWNVMMGSLTEPAHSFVSGLATNIAKPPSSRQQ